MKRNILLMVVGIAILALTGTAFAANQVFLKTTVPNIPKTPCEQAGSITQEFPTDSILHENDVIQFTLSNNVTLCKDIDFFLRLMYTEPVPGVANNVIDMGGGVFELPVSADANYPVVVTTGPGTGVPPLANTGLYNSLQVIDPDAADGSAYGTNYELGFLVKGNAGDQIFTMTLCRRALEGGVGTAYISSGDTTRTSWNDPDYGTVYEGQVYQATSTLATNTVEFSVGAGDPSDRMTVKLFDEKYSGVKYEGVAWNAATNPEGGAEWFFVEHDWKQSITATNPRWYSYFTEPEDNALCIDIMTKNYQYEYVYATPDSLPWDYQYKITFSGDYTIAHILEEEEFIVTKVCKDVCPQLNIGTDVDQFGNPISTVSSFNPGDYSTSGTTASTRWINASGVCSGSTATGILVYNTGGDLVKGEEYTITLSVLVDGVENVSAAYWQSAGGNVLYYANYNEDAICSASTKTLNTITATSAWAYVKDSSNKDIKTQTKMAFQVQYGTDDAIMIDVGVIAVDPKKLAAGQDIEVNIELSKFPCAAVVDESVCVAQVVTKCDVTSSGTYSLTFPYTTGMADENFWVGLALDNLTSTAGQATITFYDQNGTTGTVKVDIAANSQWVNVISSLSSQVVGSLNKSLPGYIMVSAPFSIDGLLFIGDMSTTYLHGYLPRK